jgi:3-methyladenine DNA glycosylase Tag
MRRFDELYAIAVERHGEDSVQGRLQYPKSPAELCAIPDDRWLSMFTRCIFQAGFNWKVVEAMWLGFEAAFHGFDPGSCAMLHDEDFEHLVSDTRIVRHGSKIRAVQENAVFVMGLAHDHGSVGNFISQWPKADYAGLLAYLKKHGTRLGGNTGQYALRFMGVDSYILSRDVTARLIAEGVVDAAPSSAKSFAAVQTAFNIWSEQSGRSLTEISRIIAMTVG